MIKLLLSDLLENKLIYAMLLNSRCMRDALLFRLDLLNQAGNPFVPARFSKRRAAARRKRTKTQRALPARCRASGSCAGKAGAPGGRRCRFDAVALC